MENVKNISERGNTLRSQTVFRRWRPNVEFGTTKYRRRGEQ